MTVIDAISWGLPLLGSFLVLVGLAHSLFYGSCERMLSFLTAGVSLFLVGLVGPRIYRRLVSAAEKVVDETPAPPASPEPAAPAPIETPSASTVDTTSLNDLLLNILLIIAIVIAAATLLCTAWLISRRVLRKSRATRGAAREAVAAQAQRWQSACARHDRVLEEYAAVETDPVQVLRRMSLFTPAAAPDSATGRFLDALAVAQSYRTETIPPDDFVDRYVRATGELARTWQEADRAATRLGTSSLPDEQARKADKAIALITRARRTDSTFERGTCLAAAQRLIDQLIGATGVQMPQRALVEIEDHLRLQITA